MYYAGLRPEEAINLAADNVMLPPSGRSDDDDWGELHLRGATPDAGSEWTDDGSVREMRQLKHRAEGDSRIVPTHPELTRLLRVHLDKSSTASDGHLFGGVRGGELPTITYRRAWIKARQTALSAAEQASPLARRPYDLRPPACPHGSTAASTRSRWPSGPGTEWTSSCGSTPSASWARTSSPSAGSPRRFARTDTGSPTRRAPGKHPGSRTIMILDLGTYWAQRPAVPGDRPGGAAVADRDAAACPEVHPGGRAGAED